MNLKPLERFTLLAPQTHRAIGAVGAGAGRSGVRAAELQQRVEAVLLAAPQQRLQGLDVGDGVAQDFHFGQLLVRVLVPAGCCRAALQGLEGVVDPAEPPALAHRRRLPPVRAGGLPLAGLAGP